MKDDNGREVNKRDDAADGLGCFLIALAIGVAGGYAFLVWLCNLTS